MTDTSKNPLREAQRIAVANNAALVVSFAVNFKNNNKKEGTSVSSSNLVFSQAATIDMAEVAGVEPGTAMKPRISIVAGSPHDGPEVAFAPNGLTATYTITGNLVKYSVDLL